MSRTVTAPAGQEMARTLTAPTAGQEMRSRDNRIVTAPAAITVMRPRTSTVITVTAPQSQRGSLADEFVLTGLNDVRAQAPRVRSLRAHSMGVASVASRKLSFDVPQTPDNFSYRDPVTGATMAPSFGFTGMPMPISTVRGRTSTSLSRGSLNLGGTRRLSFDVPGTPEHPGNVRQGVAGLQLPSSVMTPAVQTVVPAASAVNAPIQMSPQFAPQFAPQMPMQMQSPIMGPQSPQMQAASPQMQVQSSPMQYFMPMQMQSPGGQPGQQMQVFYMPSPTGMQAGYPAVSNTMGTPPGQVQGMMPMNFAGAMPSSPPGQVQGMVPMNFGGAMPASPLMSPQMTAMAAPVGTMAPAAANGLGAVTTLMLRNIPVNYNRDQLLADMDQRGFLRCYNFFYLPMDFSSGNNIGYAFVNLITPPEAERFRSIYSGLQLSNDRSNKICVVCDAAKQGLQSNVEHYRNSPVMGMEPKYHPMVFESGVQTPFPQPTRPLKQVRARATKAQAAAAMTQPMAMGGPSQKLTGAWADIAVE